MKQYPSFLKYKKYHKVNYFYIKVNQNKNFYVTKGNIGLQSLESGKINFKQIESCRRTLKRGLKKIGNLWIKLFTNVPVYKKSLASRMGKGKGNLSHWIVPIKKGTILFEISGLSLSKSLLVLNKSKTKLPFKTQIIKTIF